MQPPASSDDQSLLRKVRIGDQEAARQLYERYGEQLIALARRRISQRFSRRVDPEDIVQSVFRTFFGRAKAGEFVLEGPDDLCRLLARITVHKTLRQIAFHHMGKRDVTKEATGGVEGHERLNELLARDPTPEASSLFVDQLRHFLMNLRPQEQQIVDLRMQEYTAAEIAQKLNVSERTIRRLMERIRAIAEQEDWSTV
jgi:RNA polymerase sigma-70 factor, ECF subfamily